MKILSFVYGTHCSGVTLTENNNILYCYEEERFTRIKSSTDFDKTLFRFPYLCLNELFHKNSLDFKTIDYFLFPCDKTINSEFLHKTLSEFIDISHLEGKIKFYDHHDAHCALAYYTSGFIKDKCLVVSMDGSGDGYSAKYYLGENNKLKYIDGITTECVSLGIFYCLLTEFLGFKRLKDEGKIVGMSSHGWFDEYIYKIFNEIIGEIEYVTTKKMPYGKNFTYIFAEFYKKFFEFKGDVYFKDKLNLCNYAYTGQYIFEEKILQILNNLHKSYPEYKKLCLSGGVFANVKLNKKINELDWVDEVYITPPMGDEGLPLGACLLHQNEEHKKVFRLKDVYFGSCYSEQEINDTINITFKDFKIKNENLDASRISQLLDEGNIIGLFQGRMEHGPRALGNRTILADASKKETYKKLNDRLQRNDFMPFAPVVLAKYADRVFDIKKSKYAAEFMTMLYDTKSEWQDRIPAAVHPIDKTARIQLVYEEKNKLLYDILVSFYNLTGIPVLVNTSFNIHEEPIVCWPENAVQHLVNGIVDYLIIENKLYYLEK